MARWRRECEEQTLVIDESLVFFPCVTDRVVRLTNRPTEGAPPVTTATATLIGTLYTGRPVFGCRVQRLPPILLTQRVCAVGTEQAEPLPGRYTFTYFMIISSLLQRVRATADP